MKKTNYILLAVTLFATRILFAQDGSLDATFDSDGKVATEFGGYDSAINSLIIQPDGKIVAAGAVFDHVYSQFGLARYNSDGSLDTNFGTGGKVVSDFLDTKMSLTSMVLQPDGKIIGGGIIYNNYSDAQFVIARYNSNGTLDTSFDTDGIITGDAFHLSSLLIQSDGKIIAAGFSFLGTSRSFMMIRYNKEGDIDSGFGAGGVSSTAIAGKDFAQDAALQPDGRIILSGSVHNSSGEYNSDFAFVRYLSNGTLDATFGTGGIKIIDSDDIDEVRSIRIQSDGKILCTGWSYSSSGAPYYFKLMRLLANGTVDAGFGTAGTALCSGSLGVSPESIEIQPDGKIIVAGYSDDGYNKIAMERYHSNGNLDTTFGDSGIVTTPFSTTCRANSVAMQTDGKIIVGGEAGTTSGTYSPDFAVLRYNSGVLSITPFATQKSFVLYPNPVNEVVNLDFNLNQSEVLSMDLYDSNGRKIINLLKDRIFPMGYNSHKIELPETLSKGIYFLNISNGRNTSNIKMVK